MADELRNFLREKLPSYMVPTLIIPVPNFPHTPNGKIDRKALPDPSQFLSGQRPDEQKTRQTPATHPITQLVADILHVEHVDHRSSLFEIGANSLDIVKILNAIEKQIKFRPPIAEFLRHPTIAHLIDIYDLHQKEQVTENTMSFTIEREEGEL
jgi:acyl carrier protein